MQIQQNHANQEHLEKKKTQATKNGNRAFIIIIGLSRWCTLPFLKTDIKSKYITCNNVCKLVLYRGTLFHTISSGQESVLNKKYKWEECWDRAGSEPHSVHELQLLKKNGERK